MRGSRWLLVSTLLLLAQPLEGQQVAERPNAREAEQAIAQLRSPYCPGLMLEACPSLSASALRDSIYDLAAQGATADELVEWMLDRHGEEWRGVPLRSGAGLWAWVIPPLALIVGLGVLVGWLRSSRSSEEPAPASETAAAVSDADRQRIATALRDWEEHGEEEDV